MIKFNDELKTKLFAAKNAEEVAELLKADGQEFVPEDAAHLWEKLIKHREQDGRELSPDELEVVSGGADPNRDYLTDGCAATVEPHSWCGSNDSCVYWSVIYNNEPTINKCPTCNETLYLEYYERNNRGIWQSRYKCIHCGYTKKA